MSLDRKWYHTDPVVVNDRAQAMGNCEYCALSKFTAAVVSTSDMHQSGNTYCLMVFPMSSSVA